MNDLFFKFSIALLKITLKFFYFTVSKSEDYLIFNDNKYYSWNVLTDKWESLYDYLYPNSLFRDELLNYEENLINKYDIYVKYGFE